MAPTAGVTYALLGRPAGVRPEGSRSEDPAACRPSPAAGGAAAFTEPVSHRATGLRDIAMRGLTSGSDEQLVEPEAHNRYGTPTPLDLLEIP